MPPIPAHVENLPVVRAGIRTALAGTDVESATDTEIDDALAAIDQEILFADEQSTLEVEVWDKISPINDVPAADMIARHGVGDDPVYIILDEVGAVIFFQPHKPYVEGVQAITDPLAEGSVHRDIIVGQTVASNVHAQVLATLRGA